MDWTLLLIQTLNGLQLGVLLFLVAAGLTLVFGIMDFLNLAHGSLYMLGAFLCAILSYWTGSYIVGVILSLPILALVGLLLELTLIRKLYEMDHLAQVLATFGLILIFDAEAQRWFGAEGMSIALPDWLNSGVSLPDGFNFAGIRIAIILVGLIMALGMYLVVNKTKLGMLIRAGASDRTMVSALGVDIKSLFTLIFVIGAVLAGLAGMMIAPITEASIGMGNDVILLAFVVIIIGGLGSIRGAFIGAILVGLIDTLGRSYLDNLFGLFMSNQNAETSAPAVAAMLIYILMASVLVVRPEGLFPPKRR